MTSLIKNQTMKLNPFVIVLALGLAFIGGKSAYGGNCQVSVTCNNLPMGIKSSTVNCAQPVFYSTPYVRAWISNSLNMLYAIGRDNSTVQSELALFQKYGTTLATKPCAVHVLQYGALLGSTPF